MVVWSQVIKKQVVTEKSAKAQELNVFTFIIHQDANKVDVAFALKNLYNVVPKGIRIQKLHKKIRLLGKGRIMTRRHTQKRACVAIPSDVKLDLGNFVK
jgi:large subunit ribosomal protein L23